MIKENFYFQSYAGFDWESFYLNQLRAKYFETYFAAFKLMNLYSDEPGWSRWRWKISQSKPRGKCVWVSLSVISKQCFDPAIQSESYLIYSLFCTKDRFYNSHKIAWATSVFVWQHNGNIWSKPFIWMECLLLRVKWCLEKRWLVWWSHSSLLHFLYGTLVPCPLANYYYN